VTGASIGSGSLRTNAGKRGTARQAGVRRLWASDQRGRLLATVLVVLQISILVVPQGFDFRGVNGMPTSGDLGSRVLWLVLLGGGALMVYSRFARAREYVRTVNPFIWGFLALATASVVWSIEPAITMRRILRLVTILLVFTGFAITAWNPRRMQDLLRSIMTWLLIASTLLVLVDPFDAIHHSNQVELKDAWHGITIGKNVLGSVASTTVLLWLHGWLSKQVSAFKAACGLGIGALCLIMSRSATSLMATVFAVGFMLILLRSPGSMRRYLPYLVAGFAALILLYCLAILRLVPGLDIILAPITALTGKDLTFTGRTAIWEILNEHIRLRPWLGTGYGAYWIGRLPSSPSYEMFTRLYFYPTEGHNGYLDVINDLGIAGGVCLLGYFAAYVRQALQLMRWDRYQGGLYLAMLFRGFIADMSESHWFLVLSFDFAVMTLATMALARSLLQARLDRAAGLPARPR
jgi:exopolysaccharide production protein ExoQ